MAKRDKDPKASEVDAYVYIKENLKVMGWDVRNPLRFPTGQVFTQAESLSHPELKKYLGLDKPENIVKISEEKYWVIEAKRDRKEIKKALKEAIDYAKAINQSINIKALFVSGIAGNDADTYLVENRYWDGQEFQRIRINGKDVTALLSPELVKDVLDAGPDIPDIPVDENLFLSKAERINEILHLGAINKNERARVMAAVLLSLVHDTPPSVEADPTVFIKDINARAQDVLAKQGKQEFARFIEIALPPTVDNHLKFKDALVKTIQELNNLNIRSAMNSGTDVLGKFYEVFLKYGNGAKEIGIVLTPRHITKFAAEVMSITDRDICFDPTCGTGGFLVSVFDYIKKTHSPAQITRFKQNNLFGIDQESQVVALAVVNMIFRGDGKNNITEGNCFQNNLRKFVKNGVATAEFTKKSIKQDETAVTRVLMNPPFALKRSDEKEYKFVDYALSQMVDGGLLFSVLPYSAMVKPGKYRDWRRTSLLKNNTLLSVITFPEDLFYPIGVHTVGVFIKKGFPHPPGQKVLWIRAVNDGLLKSKGKRLPNAKASDDYFVIKDLVRAYVPNPGMAVDSKDRFQKIAPIDLADDLLELVPENYLDQAPPSDAEIKTGMEQVVRNSMAFLIRSGREDEY